MIIDHFVKILLSHVIDLEFSNICCSTSVGSLRSKRRILSPVFPTSCKDCLFCCKLVRNGQLRLLMWREALAGTAVRVSLCTCLWVGSHGWFTCSWRTRPRASVCTLNYTFFFLCAFAFSLATTWRPGAVQGHVWCPGAEVEANSAGRRKQVVFSDY